MALVRFRGQTFQNCECQNERGEQVAGKEFSDGAGKPAGRETSRRTGSRERTRGEIAKIASAKNGGEKTGAPETQTGCLGRPVAAPGLSYPTRAALGFQGNQPKIGIVRDKSRAILRPDRYRCQSRH